MLNYIWGFLIIIGITVAVSTDIKEFYNNKGESVEYDLNYTIENGNIQLSDNKINKKDHYVLNGVIKKYFDSTKVLIELTSVENAPQFIIDLKSLNKDKNLILKGHFKKSSSNIIRITFDNSNFISSRKVTNSLIDYAGTAVEIALGLIGIMTLWLGILKIGEEAGLIKKIALLLKPITKKLFPDVPSDHPALGSIVMNMSANMLGLGNAATPFGLKAMSELQTLNKDKESASNAMCMFLAINTAGFTLIPATAIAIRASLGSVNPTFIIGTTIFGALCATLTGIFSAKIFEFISESKKIEIIKIFSLKNIVRFFTGIILIGLLFILLRFAFTSGNIINIINIISIVIIPLILISFIIYGFVKKIKVYEIFTDGAKEGFNLAVKIIPFLVAMLAAISIFRSSGAMDLFVAILNPVTSLIGMPSESLSMALMRPLSGSASMGIMTEIMKQYGPDSQIGVLVSTMFGSTETTFYVLAVYYGSVSIKKIRHSMIVGILADIAGLLGALFIVKQIVG